MLQSEKRTRTSLYVALCPRNSYVRRTPPVGALANRIAKKIVSPNPITSLAFSATKSKQSRPTVQSKKPTSTVETVAQTAVGLTVGFVQDQVFETLETVLVSFVDQCTIFQRVGQILFMDCRALGAKTGHENMVSVVPEINPQRLRHSCSIVSPAAVGQLDSTPCPTAFSASSFCWRPGVPPPIVPNLSAAAP